MEPTIVFRDDRVCAACWGSVFFEIWFAPGTAAHFRLLRGHQVKYARSYPGQKVALFTVVMFTSLPPLDRETRRELDERTHAMTPHVLAGVVVLPAQGFVASVVRSVLAGAALLRRPAHSSKVCTSIEDGCAWVVQHLPPMNDRPVHARDLQRACEQAMARGAPVGALAG
jgi:hypothetical protein